MTAPTVASVKAVSNKLAFSLVFLVACLSFLYVAFIFNGLSIATLPAVLALGAIGAFVSLQRRLKSFSEEDLLLLRESITYTWLAPIAGALLAGVLYLLFIGGLLSGSLFPTINTDSAEAKTALGFAKLFQVYSPGAGDYAKLLFWCFVAGFSESFVTDIIGRFEAKTTKND